MRVPEGTDKRPNCSLIAELSQGPSSLSVHMTPFIGQGGTEGFHSPWIFHSPQCLGNLGTQLAFFPFFPIEIKVQVPPVLVIHHLRCWRMHHFGFRSEEYRDERLDRPLVAKETQGFSSCEPDLSFFLPL